MCEKECVKCKITQENSALTEATYEMLVLELKYDFYSLTVKSDDEECESEEKEQEAIDNDRKITHERHNVETMKSGYVRGCIKGKDIAERMKK